MILFADPCTQYPLNVEFHQRYDGFTIRCASRSDFFNQANLLRLVHDLRSFVEGIVCNPDNPIITDLPNIFDSWTPPPRALIDGANTDGHEDDAHLTVDISPYQEMLSQLSNTPISKISARTPLVALGIDSITAIQIVSKIRASGFQIATTDIINSRTVGRMVLKISPLEAVKETKPSLSMTLKPTEVDAIRNWLGVRADLVEKFSFASAGMKWLISAWQRSRGTRYHHAFAFKLPSDIKVRRLRLAWSQLVKKHWLLRSTFCFVNGLKDVRIVTFRDPEEGSWIESNEDAPPLLEQMQAMLIEPPALQFSQARALLLKSSNHLILHLHHFQYDAWSLPLLLIDLVAFYRDLVPPASSNMDVFTLHYSQCEDHVRVQQEYWGRFFTPGLFQPSYVAPFLTSLVQQTHQRVLKTKHYPKLSKDLCSTAALGHQVSLQSIYLACWSQIQAEITASSTTTFGLWHSGRTGMVEDIDRLAAPCMNVVPMRVDLAEGESLVDLARRLHSELQIRTDIIEQSEQAMINRLAGLFDRPICNVFVNIIKTGSNIPSPRFFEPVEVRDSCWRQV